MYLVESPHPFKTDAQRLLEKLISERQRLITDAEVMQEVLHRYASVNRHHTIQPAYDALLKVVDETFSIDRSIMGRAKQIVLGQSRLSARDAVHLAVIQQHGISEILSFDSGFDGFPGITRLS